MRFILSVLTIVLFSFSAPSAFAQAAQPLPQLPEPIQNLVNEGAQIRYLGKDNGLDAWLTVKNGVEQYFYVMPDREAFVMGVMFDKTGKLVTVEQVNRLRAQGDDLLDSLTDVPEANNPKALQKNEIKTPAEQMFSDVEDSNWVPFGQPGAPILYAFVEMHCPHCHSFMNDLKNGKYLDEGKVQLRLIPLGFKEEAQAQAAFLLASPNPQERWFNFLAGQEDALPAKAEINKQGVQRNMAVMQSWKFDATPMAIYRGRDGSVKIIRGKPQDLAAVVADLQG